MDNIKMILKKNRILVYVYSRILRFVICWMSLHRPVTLSKIQYKKRFKRKLDLKNPVYFNEKLMWLKFYRYTDNPLVTRCIDKYTVRNYVEECGLSHILNELYCCWEKASDINWDKLPNKFVIKCNHGCGFNIICRDRGTFDTKEATRKLNNWMHKESWTEFAETNYRNIPKKIICETFLEGKNGELPVDYKIYCFNGEPLYIGNFIERNMEEDSLVRGYFDLDWKPSNVFKYRDEMDISKFSRPKRLDDMIEYARKLSKPFPFVRVDFYEVNDEIIFGELTFSPTGCLATYYTEEACLELGNALDIASNEK